VTASLVGGLIAGLLYGLVACAVVFIYKASRVINLAQGDLGMLAAFVFLTVSVVGDVPVLLGLLLALATGGVLGWLMNKLVIQPLGSRDQGTGLVASLAVATILQLAALELWGGSARFFPPWLPGWHGFSIAGFGVRGHHLLAVSIGLLLAGAGALLYQRTAFGLQLRAISENREAATMTGVDARRISSYAWLLGGFVSVAAALLIAPMVRFDSFFMFALMTKALVAALLAGFDSLARAMAAALAIGTLEGFINFSVSLAGVSDALLLLLTVAILLLRPPVPLRAAA
jgi:branched-chain amino acid transport system permease protein